MILSLGSYVRYPADNIRFRLIAKLKLSSNLLVTDAFACWVLVYFVSQVIFFLVEVNKLRMSVGSVLKGFTKSFGKLVMECTFLVKLLTSNLKLFNQKGFFP